MRLAVVVSVMGRTRSSTTERRGWRVDPLLVAIVALSFSAAAAVAPLATAAAAGLSLAILAPRMSLTAVGVVLIAFGAGWHRACSKLSSFERDYAGARDF